MNKTIKSIILLFAVSSIWALSAQSAKPTAKVMTFPEKAAALKTEIFRKNSPTHSFFDLTLNGTSKPQKIQIDVKGLDRYVLGAWDYNNCKAKDYLLLNNAVLIDSLGNKTLLNGMKNKIQQNGVIRFRIGFNNGFITYKGKELYQAIQFFPPAQITIPLDKKYEKLELELMLDGSEKTTINFKTVNQVGKKESDLLAKSYPKEMPLFVSYSGTDLRTLLSVPGSSLERSVAKMMIDRVDQPQSLLAEWASIAKLATTDKQISAYLQLFFKAADIFKTQERLSLININAIDKAFDYLKNQKGYDAVTNAKRLADLKLLVQTGFADLYTGSFERAQKALDLKYKILIENPALDFDKIIMGKYVVGSESRNIEPDRLGTPPSNWSNQTSARRSGFDAQIIELSNLRGKIQERSIYKAEGGSSLPDIRLNSKADRILFTMNEPGEHHWQVYEIGVDGTGLQKITDGSKEDLDYFDANYLPNGKMAVISNVGGQGVPCVNGSDQVGNLCLFDPKTKDMRRLTFDQDANWGPVMMHNGKIMFTRWEYTDLTHYFSRFVMSMNPDGTEQKALFGSGMVFPNSIFDIQPLPNHPSRFVGIISGHHGTKRSGRMFIFDPAISRTDTSGMVHEFPHAGRRPEVLVKDMLVNWVWPQFVKPFPLDNNHFLVSVKLSPKGLWGIYLVDTFDNMTLLYETEGNGYIHATPLKITPELPVIPDKIDLKKKDATVFIQDIYEGVGLKGVPKGTVKQIRVFSYEYAYVKSPSDHTAQGIQSGWDIKRLLGTVPVESDGSATFKVPANTPISLQPLDSEGRAIQWMRSWFSAMPGENVSCVGCHEDQNQIVLPKRVIASTIPPHLLETPKGGVRSFTFDYEIQPILDRNCTACHNANSKINLTGGRKDPKGYGMSYLQIHPFIHRQGPEAGMQVLFPYEYHANVSPLVQMLNKGHYGVQLTDQEKRVLYNWIDFNAPDKGIFELDSTGFDKYARRIDLNNKYANGMSVDWKKELADYAGYLASQPKPTPVVPTKVTPKFKEVKVKNYPFNAVCGEKKQVEIAPGVVVNFVRIPAGSFVMGKNQLNSDNSPAFKAKVEKAFWMSEKEISNEQFKLIFPDHDSRFVDQQWKDHVNEGYPANKPQQPVIRVSWQQANEYTQKLAAKTGLKIMLPTEIQWEWACRGGSNTDFWYGDMNTDFSQNENLSDKQMLKMAVSGVNPQPMSTNNEWYKYYSWHPKVETVDDGNMIMAIGGSYKSNPFGLYDMHGNVAEWTRSDFTPYPLTSKQKATSDYKVVRGGSWKDHPKKATSYARKGYYPWQAVHNVGIRLVIED